MATTSHKAEKACFDHTFLLITFSHKIISVTYLCNYCVLVRLCGLDCVDIRLLGLDCVGIRLCWGWLCCGWTVLGLDSVRIRLCWG